MTNKMTNRKALTAAISVMTNLKANPATSTISIDGTTYNVSDVVDKLENMATSLDNKAASPPLSKSRTSTSAGISWTSCGRTPTAC